MAINYNDKRIKKLIKAFDNKNIEEIKSHIEKRDPDMKFVDRNGCNYLLMACQKNLPELAEYVINRGINLYNVNEDGETILHIACKKNSTIAKLIINKIVELGNLEYFNMKTKDILKIYDNDILEAGEYTPLMYCIKEDNYEIAKLLINSGCDVNVQNNAKQTVLHIICDNYNYKDINDTIEIIDLLINSGCNMYLRDMTNKRAIDMKYINDHIWIIDNMINRMYDDSKLEGLDNPDVNGNTLMHYQCMYDNVDIVRKLLKMGCKVIPNNNGQLPLTYGLGVNLLDNTLEFVELFMEYNIDILNVDKDKKTFIEYIDESNKKLRYRIKVRLARIYQKQIDKIIDHKFESGLIKDIINILY